LRAAVTIVRGDDRFRRPEQLQHQGDGGHARARHHSVRAAFELTDRTREMRSRGIAAARVVVLARLAE
jgi:hypothetical protein